MASEFTINQIIEFQQISQFLSMNDRNDQIHLKSGSLIKDLPELLYMEGDLLLNMNSLNPNSSTLRSTAEYVLSLCSGYLSQAQKIIKNLSGSLPVLTGPANQTVLVGQTATFSVSVVSATPVSYQWYLNNILIPGATSSSFIVSNAQLIQSGGLYSVTATNATGSVTSNQGLLTVTQSLIGYAYYGNTDYSTQLLSGTDAVPFNFTFPITTGQPLSVQFPVPVAAEYIVIKYPSTESTKIHYDNLPIDSGPIPNIAFEPVTTITTWKYIFSRTGNPFTLNPANLLTLS